MSSLDTQQAWDSGREPPAVVLLAGYDLAMLEKLRSLAGDSFVVEAAASSADVLRALSRQRVAVLSLGPGFASGTALELLTRIHGAMPDSATVHLVLAAGPEPELFQEPIDQDQIFFLTREPPPLPEQLALLRNAVRLYERRIEDREGPGATGPRQRLRSPSVVETLDRLALQSDPGDMMELLAEAAREVAAADQAYCLLHDRSDETLWGPISDRGGERRESASVGLVSFVLRSGLSVHVERLDQDSRFDPEADHPRGDGSDRFLGVPLAAPDGEIFGVLVVVRSGAAPHFDGEDRAAIEHLAGQGAALLGRHALAPPQPVMPATDFADRTGGLFRQEAVASWVSGGQEHGDPLRISPLWIRWSYRGLVACLAIVLVFLSVVEIDEYATGAAVVRSGGRIDLTAPTAGTVAAVVVAAGEPVVAGQELLRFHDAAEMAELDRIEHEFELQLVKRLRAPSDASAESALFGLQAARQRARSQLEELTLRAPVDGRVSDLWVRPGQYLQPGQIALSLVGDETEPFLVVLVPGEYRPQLAPGMDVRFEIAGFRHMYQRLAVRAVSDEVVSPREALRYLGPAVDGTVQIAGPVALVEADLPASTFTAAAKTYRYHDGMYGTAEIRVRREKAIFTLVPGLRALTGNAP